MWVPSVSFVNSGEVMYVSSAPAGLNAIFGCVRPVIFENKDYGFESVTGTGFLLSFLGDVFFVTALHVLKAFDFDNQPPCVVYSLGGNHLLPMSEMRTFRAVDERDTDHVDVAVYRVDANTLDRTEFQAHHPYELGPDNLIRHYTPSMTLHFQGCPSENVHFDYDEKKHSLWFASGDLIYQEPASCLHVHIGRAHVSASCPDFDGLSGSPVFQIDDKYSQTTPALFAGMLIRATRSSNIMRFLSAECISNYIYGFFVEGLTQEAADKRVLALFEQHYGTINL